MSYRFRAVFAVRTTSVSRNPKDCCTKFLSSERHEQRAHWMPSACAAREWPQYSQRFMLVTFTGKIVIKNSADSAFFFRR
jgi:hypothetical protein